MVIAVAFTGTCGGVLIAMFGTLASAHALKRGNLFGPLI